VENLDTKTLVKVGLISLAVSTIVFIAGTVIMKKGIEPMLAKAAEKKKESSTA